MTPKAEPRITINGIDLTDAQAMTVRVAVNDMLLQLRDPEYLRKLGPIGRSYKLRLQEIQAAIVEHLYTGHAT